MNRLETAVSPEPVRRADRPPRAGIPLPGRVARRPLVWRAIAGGCILVAMIGGGAFAASRKGVDFRSFLDVRSVVALSGDFASPEASTPAPVAREATLVLPRRGELVLANARALMARGHFHEALTALETVRATDPQRADADRLRADIQQQLIALATLPAVPEPAAPAQGKVERRLP